MLHLNNPHPHPFPCGSNSCERTHPTPASSRDDAIPFSQLIENEDHVTKKVRKNSEDEYIERPVLIGLTSHMPSSKTKTERSQETHSEHELHFSHSDKTSINTPLISTAHHSTKMHSSDNDDMNDLIEMSSGGEEFQLKKRTCSEYLFSRKQSSAYQSSEEEHPRHHQHSHSHFHNDLTQEIVKLLEAQGASLTQKYQRIYSTDSIFSVKCAMGHFFDSSYIKIRQLMRKFGYRQENSDESDDQDFCYNYQQLCTQCQPKLKQAQQYARQHKGYLRSKAFNHHLEFQCQVGHHFSLNSKDYSRKWCQQCKKLVKQQFKEFLKSEEEKRQQEYEEKQKELYKEARQYYKKSFQEDSDSDHNGNSIYNNYVDNFHPEAQKVISAAKVVEGKLKILAEKKAEKFFEELKEGNNEISSSVSCQEAVDVYKMIMFPDEVLKCFFEVLDKPQLKKQFREYARHIHPDKNHHPDSSKAFQKLYTFYQNSLQKLQQQEHQQEPQQQQ